MGKGKGKGSKFHPARISGKQKFLRNLEAQKLQTEKKEMKILDIKKQDWSLN